MESDLTMLAHAEGAVSAAARVTVNAAKAMQADRAAIGPQNQARYDEMTGSLLGIGREAVSRIASFMNAAVGREATVRPGATGLLSLLMETGAGALGTVIQSLLEEKDHPIEFLQALARLLQLRKAATGETTGADEAVSQAI